MTDPLVVRRLIDEVVADYLDRSAGGLLPSLADAGRAARDVYDAVAGLGRLQRYLDDPMVEEIWINGRLTSVLAKTQRSRTRTYSS
jgi:pilus assembly protein CpaF